MHPVCQRCNKARATVHITDTAPQKRELHLCEECAEKEGVIIKHHHQTTNAILQEFIKQKTGGSLADDLACPKCGTTFKEFQTKGLLGCPNDYQAFRHVLLPLIERAHGAGTHHSGKVPQSAEAGVRKKAGLLQLRRELQEAVKQENYERAARVRDQIRALSKTVTALDDMIRSTGEWLRGEVPMSEVVISSRIRLARNLSDFPFLSTAGDSERTEIYRLISEEILSATPEGRTILVDMEDTEPLDRELLVERHLISRQHASGEGARGVTLSPEETRALMINEEDHLRIQTLRSGLQLEAAWEEVSGIDDQLGRSLNFAFDRKLGYLTACPTNVGTGIRVSVMVHLPALKLTKEIERVARAAKDMRLAIRGLYGEGTEAIGDLYQISNQTTLGRSEQEIIESLGERTIPKIVEYEMLARDSLARTRSHQLDDKIWRAYGILSHARRIGHEEAQSLLSPLRMGIHMDRFREFDIKTLNELFLMTQPAHLQKLQGQPLSEDEQAVVRADFFRKRLARRPA